MSEDVGTILTTASRNSAVYFPRSFLGKDTIYVCILYVFIIVRVGSRNSVWGGVDFIFFSKAWGLRVALRPPVAQGQRTDGSPGAEAPVKLPNFNDFRSEI